MKKQSILFISVLCFFARKKAELLFGFPISVNLESNFKKLPKLLSVSPYCLPIVTQQQFSVYHHS